MPASFVEFTAGRRLRRSVSACSLYGGIASLVRRDDIRRAPARTEILLDRIALALVLAAFVVSLPLWLLGRATVDAAAARVCPR